MVEVVSGGDCGSGYERWWLVAVGVSVGVGSDSGLGLQWVGCFCLGERDIERKRGRAKMGN